jgi:hypothetical protein
VALVLKLMNKLLNFTTFLKMIVGGSRMYVYPPPKQFAYRVVSIPVMVGLRKLIFTECAKAPFLIYQTLPTGIAQFWINKR